MTNLLIFATGALAGIIGLVVVMAYELAELSK